MRIPILAFSLVLAAVPAQGATPNPPPTSMQKNAPPKQPVTLTDENSEAGSEAGSEEEKSESEETEVSEKPVKPATQVSTGKDNAPGEVHSVVKGDTLWDLSQRYLGSPWYWPKVWSYNPEIANPHWIYPGNRVRFYPGGDEGPSRVDVATPEGELADSDDVHSPDHVSLESDAEVRVSGKIGYQQKPGIRVRRQGFLTPKQLQESGVIASSFAETLGLSYPDTAYISFPNKGSVKVGDRYIIFRTVVEVAHPVTHKRYGYLTHVIGTVRVLKTSDQLVTALINPDTWDEVRRGDRIGPHGEQLREVVTQRPNDRDLKGYVIGVLVPYLTVSGEHSVIIVDKGRSDGVELGQTFTVIRQQDPISPEAFLNPSQGQDRRLPVEDVGACMAIDVKENASMCIVTRSIREIVYGDRLEMRADNAKEPRASAR